MRTCFDNILRLEINHDNMDILAMISAEGEKVPFNKACKARGQVEVWLGLV